MRVLVVLSHYFSPEESPRYGSVNKNRRGERKAAIERVIDSWRNEFGTGQAVLSPAKRAYEYVPPPVDEVSIRVLTMEGRHLLEDEFCKSNSVSIVTTAPTNPRMLGFEAAKLFAELRHRYDVFIFSEDDLLVQDPLFLDKIVWFTETFGYRRLLMPNRFEWNVKGPAMKTFIDGDVAPRLTDKWLANSPDEDFLSQRVFSRTVSFRRARNPHSGMYVLTREQLSFWMQQPHWADQDTSFVGPLESAATLGVLKTFSIYKSWGRSFGFLGVEHLDNRYSSLRTKLEDQVKPAESKPAAAKPAEPAPVQPKTAEIKSAKTAEPKPAQPAKTESAEAKPAEPNPVQPKAAEAKPPEVKPAEPQPAEAKPAKPQAAEAGQP